MAWLKKVWHFIWHDDSLASWLVNLVLAFVLVKYLIYPALGLLFGTSFPIVAVVSGSMEHDTLGFDAWWERSGSWYEQREISKDYFSDFPFHNGFRMGDIMILRGIAPKDIKVGDVLVYESSRHPNPIIHRVVDVQDINETYSFQLKGDHNYSPDNDLVTAEHLRRTGKAVMRIPYLGWVKIWFVRLLGLN
ncbi:MAG: signal peptidase I [Nanoarchaeota archaeon]